MLQRLVLPAHDLVIAERLRSAGSARERTRGLLGTDRLQPGAGLLLAARQVHTFGMRYAIDVVFCDGDWRVLHVIHEMRPNRMSRLVPRAHWVVELCAGAAESVEPGDRLMLEPSRS